MSQRSRHASVTRCESLPLEGLLEDRSEDTRGLLLRVVTGNRRYAGTDANVWVTLIDADGRQSQKTFLNRCFRNDLERDQTSEFHVKVPRKFGPVKYLVISRDKFGFGNAWFLDRIEVMEASPRGSKELVETRVFPFIKWIKAKKTYIVQEYDCCLPHHDHHLAERRNELASKRKVFQYGIKINPPYGPVQVKNVPLDEDFAGYYLRDFLREKLRLLVEKIWIKITTRGKREKLDDILKVYNKHDLPKPMSADRWKDDEYFGLSRVQGPNPVLLELCTVLPEHMDLSDELLRDHLEGLTLQEALEMKKLFMVDLRCLKGIYTVPDIVLAVPTAIFFLNEKGITMPIAIQLFPEKGPDNPVFTPSDPEYTWLVAKMYYSNADAVFHQSCTHLGFTHLLMEGVSVCTHRNLSPSHPVFKLLAPHFLFLIAINARGLRKLVNPGGWVDKTMSVGTKGMFQLITERSNQWHFMEDGCVPRQILKRGLTKEVLPHYPYRDDAEDLHAVIRRYVEAVVSHYYKDNDAVARDEELQSWRKELTAPKTSDGVGFVNGVPGNAERGFRSKEDVVDTVAVIISICSLSHAAANFPQYEAYGFPPAYPGILKGAPPKTKDPLSEKDVLARLPSREITLNTMIVTHLLSLRATQSLGDFEVDYLYDPVCVEAIKRFRAELEELSADIKRRNAARIEPYDYLDPVGVPNAISI